MLLVTMFAYFIERLRSITWGWRHERGRSVEQFAVIAENLHDSAAVYGSLVPVIELYSDARFRFSGNCPRDTFVACDDRGRKNLGGGG